MATRITGQVADVIRDFSLPTYAEIPDMGLYLDQTVRYISEHTEKLHGITITSSMIGNYVKKGLIDNPVKKLYFRDQIAYLMFIAIAKSVLSLEDIQLLMDVQKKVYENKTAYEYFVREFTNVLFYVFGLKDSLDAVGKEDSDEKTMLRNTIIAVAHKIYLDECFALIHNRNNK
ncbi:MAG: DUF1836 domain-containing protein [Clostridia bacterium]|nr:DUF1836 domain-containing protein [Clostridia bacterium]